MRGHQLKGKCRQKVLIGFQCLPATVLALFCCFLWGSAFPFIKLGYQYLYISSGDVGSQIVFAGIRFMIAGILVILFGSIANRKFLRITAGNVKPIIVLAAVQTVLQYFFFYIGLAHTTGVKGSIITGAGSLLAVLFACLLFRMEKFSFRKVLGCVIGFAGVIIVNWSKETFSFDMSLCGEGFVFLSAVSYAFSTIFIKRFSQQERPETLSGYQFLTGGFVLSLIGYLLGGKLEKSALLHPGALAVLLYLGLLSAVAYTLWGILLKRYSVGKIAVFGFSIPAFGVLLSAFILGEQGQVLGIYGVAAVCFVCSGIWLVNTSARG